MNQTSSAILQRILRRFVFFLFLIGLTLANLFLFFKGLSSPMGIDQAQIAREISRGNGFTTKVVRPLDYQQKTEMNRDTAVSFFNFKDSYHAPLNPLLNAAVFKMINASDSTRWLIKNNKNVFPLDRVIAAVSTVCFLLSIGVTYLLVSKLFDQKIAAITAILMLFCETFWSLSLSGLPQMLMLLFFVSGLFFMQQALQKHEDQSNSYLPASIAGIFFTLVSLTHYLGIWIAIGYIVFTAIAFRPRGLISVTCLVILLLPFSYIIYRNTEITGSPFGLAFFNIYKGIGGNIENLVMRGMSLSSYSLINDNLVLNVLENLLIQTGSLIPLLGGIIVAPVFFVSLLHPFKHTTTSLFRWGLMMMFIFGAVGLSIFGISDKTTDSNQIHFLFAPIMAAYGLAFISVLWKKLSFVQSNYWLGNAHYLIIIGICSLPMIFSLPAKVKLGLHTSGAGIPQWPPYYPVGIHDVLAVAMKPNAICFSDQPWAVAWYADRTSIWIPPTKKEFISLENSAERTNTTISGILISPESHGVGNYSDIIRQYKDFTSLVITGTVNQSIKPSEEYMPISLSDLKIKDVMQRYPYPLNIISSDLVFYSANSYEMLKADSE